MGGEEKLKKPDGKERKSTWNGRIRNNSEAEHNKISTEKDKTIILKNTCQYLFFAEKKRWIFFPELSFPVYFGAAGGWQGGSCFSV
jgi:hypothetical protein